jgi:TP901 family phage tail tape measure protein
MALNQLGLGFLFTARDEASRVIGKIERSFGKLNDVQKQHMKMQLTQGAIGAGAMLAGWKGFGGIANLAKEAGEFKQVLADVGVISGATGAEMKKLHDASYSSQFATPKESAQALLDLAQAGYNAKDSISLLQPSLDMMAASLGDLSASASANLTAQTLKAFGLEASQADLVTDKLINTANDFALKARELPLLIGRASRGAISFGASLEETLVAVGLARNVMGGIEVAASGVSMAMERIVDPKHQKKLSKIGVSAVDATGHFKNFSNLLLEIQGSPFFQKKTFAQQEAFILSVFGHRSLAAVQAFYKQVNSGIRTQSGELLKGAAAVEYLMGRTQNAGGAKQRFIEAHFGDNLPGQMQLLKTALAKLRTSVGETFEPIFAHAARAIRRGVDKILEAWNKLSPGTRAALGKATLVVLGLVTAFGALVTAKAGIAVLTGVLAAFGVTIKGLIIAMWPFAAAVAAIALGAYLIYRAYKSNFGGFAEFVDGVWNKIKLSMQGLVQLFSKGEFSGAVMTEIDKAENSGVKAFVIKLWGWGMRIKNFFVGIGQGFKSVWPDLELVFGQFLDALRELGSVFGITIGSAEDNARTFRTFGEVGRDVGQVIAEILIVGVEALTLAVKGLTTGLEIGKTLWDSFGASSSGALGVLIGAFQVLLGIIGLDGDMIWRGFTRSAEAAIRNVAGMVFGLAKAVAYSWDLTNRLVGNTTNFGGRVEGFQAEFNGKLGSTPEPGKSMPSSPTMPSPAQAEAQNATDLTKAMQQLAATMQGKPTGGGQPGVAQINVSIGGEKIMSTLARLARADASQGYTTPAAEPAE